MRILALLRLMLVTPRQSRRPAMIIVAPPGRLLASPAWIICPYAVLAGWDVIVCFVIHSDMLTGLSGWVVRRIERRVFVARLFRRPAALDAVTPCVVFDVSFREMFTVVADASAPLSQSF